MADEKVPGSAHSGRLIAARNADLLLVALGSAALVVVALAFPGVIALRVALGLPFFTFLPGYALLAAVFPGRAGLGTLERLALSFGLSLALVILLMLPIHYASPWKITLNTSLAFINAFILLSLATAFYRRRVLPPQEVFTLTVPLALPQRTLQSWRRLTLVGRLSAITIALAIAALVLATYFAAIPRPGSEMYTEFYVLGPGGLAAGYPKEVVAGRPVTLTAGVVNREGERATYRLEVRAGERTVARVNPVVLEHLEKWEGTITFAVPTPGAPPGTPQKVEFLLYKEPLSEPYRSLHLLMDVKAAVAPAPSFGEAKVRLPADSPGRVCACPDSSWSLPLHFVQGRL